MTIEAPAGTDRNCKLCGTANSFNSRFCSACGSPVGSEWDAIERFIDIRIPAKIKDVLRSDFKDQKY